MTKDQIRQVNIDIGVTIKATRKRMKITQTVVAEWLGVDQPALSRIENGRQSLTASQWLVFCQNTGASYQGVIE